jgi:uncharacterized protein YbcC (UPF0753/DUF2309 family)
MQELMSLIDKNSQRIPEGDYIRMCDYMKQLNKKQNTLRVTPDVVSEDFIMTSDALNRCHKWIIATDTLRDAFIEHEKDPTDKVKLGIFKQIREASKQYWYELTQTHGYEELMWFVYRGTVAQRHFRYYSVK